MTGLRAWARDAQLPARAGDPGLVAPSPTAVLELVGRHLLAPGAPEPREAVWTYARWKPGTSLCTAWSVRFDDGVEHTLVVKRYAGGKASLLTRRPLPSPPGEQRLAPAAVLPWEGLHLWVSPWDRELPGLPRLADMRRTRRLLEPMELFGTARMRSHRSRLRQLRYRPEARAVLRLDAGLKHADGQRSSVPLAIRVLPPDRAAAILYRRRAFGRADFVPDLLGGQERTGLLVERWLDVTVRAPDVFDHAQPAGRLLARLHERVPRAPPPPARRAPRPSCASVRPLLDWDPELARLLAGLSLQPVPRAAWVWTHGDFHPDQLGWDAAGEARVLLDLDRLAPGDPLHDLASWVADALAADADTDLEAAAGPLLAGYRMGAGPPVDERALSASVAQALVRQAAASCRRLEQGAADKARRLLLRAQALTGRGRTVVR